MRETGVGRGPRDLARIADTGGVEPADRPASVRGDPVVRQAGRVHRAIDGADPATQSGWVFKPATFEQQISGDEFYLGQFTAPTVTTTTTFYTGYRFSLDGGLNFTYCDRDGAGSDPTFDFNPDLVGRMTVTPTPP